MLQENLLFKSWRLGTSTPPGDLKKYFKDKLQASDNISAVTVCFSDIEGRLHLLDYDKNFILESDDNLTFDGSSIRGFTNQNESDLRLSLDWNSYYSVPSALFYGKSLIFAEIQNRDGSPYACDMRGRLKTLLEGLSRSSMRVFAAAEIEGFLFKTTHAEKRYKNSLFEYVTTGGYYNDLPSSELRRFIDNAALVQREFGFENEKDHPEVAPSQFELNWKYTDALHAADQIQLYKMICRVIAERMGYTASFLPKPVANVNGSGMHTNISIHDGSKNIMYEDGKMSPWAIKFADGILHRAKDICLVLNSSVNSYRRLDPHYEAPNEIFSSSIDRGAMIRFPLCNKNSARIEVRSVAPDANPYMVLYTLIRAGLAGQNDSPFKVGQSHDLLPTDIYSAIGHFGQSPFMAEILGPDAMSKYMGWKQASADRCPRMLGKNIKPEEILFHHEVTNQHLWQDF